MEKMQLFIQSKKWLAMALATIVSISIPILNSVFEMGLNVNIIFAILGLDILYILRQGSLDSKKTDKNIFKPFWDSKKFIAMTIGTVVPIIVGFINAKYKINISSELILGIVGLDAGYILMQGTVDSKDPDKH